MKLVNKHVEKDGSVRRLAQISQIPDFVAFALFSRGTAACKQFTTGPMPLTSLTLLMSLSPKGVSQANPPRAT